ncbi:MAG TPA: GspH/FimT family pseudopilin [Luteibacter sp.]|nr:GspH/FimT family pseudopilin [Luteibacter sp.]
MPLSRRRGFTWLELLVVLAIVGLTASLALPSLGTAIARRHLDASTEALLNALGQARTAAVRRDHATTVCASTNGHTCSPWADWTRGWIGRDDRLGTVFEVMGPLHSKLATARRAGRPHGVAFDVNGTSPGSNQTITLCVRGQAATAISVIVANSGLARRTAARADDAATCAATSSPKR